MILSLTAVVFGLLLLVWSAGRFVEGAALTARHFGMPPLLVGMVIVGFGTSAPEMVVSALAALQGNPGIALGNAYGSNIANIALILGVTALIAPIAVRSRLLRIELPVLAVVTGLAIWQLWDGRLSRPDAIVLLGVFCCLMGWSIRQGMRPQRDTYSGEASAGYADASGSPTAAMLRLAIGLILLIVSSRILVWGAVETARGLGISDLIVGLTIMAIGTSLPELASSIIATRKGEHEIALGNVIGSNLFNTLAVVGIAGAIHPMAVEPAVLYRDMPVMMTLTLALFMLGYARGRQGRINRFEGAALLACFGGYNGWLIGSVAL
ncbi:cation:H+ antiporter [Kushneria sinocarnis]|uniref:Cation:H+ antiporter n=1 Tax=Kushneria sinocarnis TaxID=595502 RepID=A0A420WT35_9GAMM|nr:calcium/sodium antiporter [Kushneria sinocarnis]RKQ95774.1 cation:H+ antiporter [Kushneria sinocarnis]